MSWIHKQIFLAGAKRRNPKLFKHYSDLKESEKFSRKQLLDNQQNQLKDFVRFAYSHSAFYRNHFDKAGFDPVNNWSIGKFSEVTSIRKQDLIENNDTIHTSVAKSEKSFFVETSGTSGEILTFHRDESWDSFNRAAIWRGMSWYGVEPWDYSLYFWGYNSDWKKRLRLRFMDMLVNRYRVFDYDPQTMSKLKNKLEKFKVIEGYSSMIYELANITKDHELEFKNLKLVKGTSEKIFPHYQDISQQVFGRRITSEYGATECSIIAFECPEGNMHLTTEGLYTEQDPENGGILVTNLKSRSFPIIRYSLGDSVKFADPDFFCPCGMHHPVINEVTGRIGSKILGREKKYPSLTLYYIFKNIYFNEGKKIDFQAHQFKKGNLEIWVKGKVSSELRSLIVEESKNYFSDLELEIVENDDFRQQQGKLRDFISHID